MYSYSHLNMFVKYSLHWNNNLKFNLNIHPTKNKALSSFTHTRVVLRLYDLLSSVEHKRRYWRMLTIDFPCMGSNTKQHKTFLKMYHFMFPRIKKTCFVTSIRVSTNCYNGSLRRERVPASDVNAEGTPLPDCVMKHK